MIKENECIQMKVGSCTGCNIQGLLEKRLRVDGLTPKAVADQVQTDWCPPDAQIQMPERIKKSVW